MKDHEIRLGGSGGQGLVLAGSILATACTLDGLRVAQSQSYEPTSRGGLSRSDLVIAEDTVDYPLATALDYLLLLDQIAVQASVGLLTDDSIVICDAQKVVRPPVGPFGCHTLPLIDTALALGNVRVANIVALGALGGFANVCTRASLEAAVEHHAPKGFLELNLEALNQGFVLATASLASPGRTPQTA